MDRGNCSLGFSMKTLFLTSNAALVISTIVKTVNLKNTKKLAFITTPAEGEDGDKWWLEADKKALRNADFDVFEYTITSKKADAIRKDLSNADFIFISGGNTFYCLEKAQESGFIKVIRDLVLRENKVYIGSNAGSVIAGPDIYPAYNLDDASRAPNLKGYKGFGLTDVVTLPHWGSDNFKNLYMNKRLEITYNPDNKIILLTDNQYLHVKDDWYKVVEV